MSPIYVPGKVVLRQTWQPMDPDAAAYITAVETADGQALEEKTKIAIDNFVLGCKADGIWTAIKASCILAGARTLTGALVPLAGTAPTNVGPFVSGDYNRKTGLVGDGSAKYLNSGAAINTTCPLNNAHLSVYVTTAASSGTGYIGMDDISTNTGELGIYRNNANFNGRFQSSGTYSTSRLSSSVGLVGIARANGSLITFRSNAVTDTISYASIGSSSSTANVAVFSRDIANASSRSNGRLAFYSIGESLNLTLLDARVTDLINAFAAAIP
jgi:hypothetical protein